MRFPRLACFALLCALPAAGGAAPFEVTQLRESDEHPRVLLAPRPGGVALLQVVFQAGVLEEQGQRGLAHLTVHALLEANAKHAYEPFLLGHFSSGAQLSWSVGLDSTTLTLTSRPEDFERHTRELLDRLFVPRFVEARFLDSLERAKGDVLARSSVEELDGVVAALLTHVSPVSLQTASPKGLASYELRDVHSFSAGPISAANAIVIATGQFDPGSLRKLLLPYKGGRPGAGLRPGLDLPFTKVVRFPQELHIAGFPVQLATPTAAASARVFEKLLADRIRRRFRDSGVAYTAQVALRLERWMDRLLVVLPGRDPSGYDLGQVLWNELADLRSGKVSEAEFTRFRQGALHELRATDRSPHALAVALQTAATRPHWYGPASFAALESLTLDQLKGFLQATLLPERRVQISLGPNAREAVFGVP